MRLGRLIYFSVKRSRKQIIMFSYFLITTIIIWLVINLNKTATTSIFIPIVVERLFKDQPSQISSELDIECKVEGLGFNLIMSKFFDYKEALRIPTTELDSKIQLQDTISSLEFKSALEKRLSSKLTLISIVGDNLDLTPNVNSN